MKILDGKKLKSMLISASNNLYNHYPEVDALNVFPIPDGDTGINMNLTLFSGLKEIQYRTDNDCYVIAKAFASGLFDGTRGNSGAITSQIFAGFAKGILNKSTLTVFDLSDAFIEAKKTAYKAVLKPVEGTILTVIREAGEKLASVVNENMSIEQAFDVLVKEANESLKRTPNLLPVLKEVGVVDSGGAGLCIVLEGMQSALLGKPIERKDETNLTSSNGEAQVLADAENTEFGYCTEFILKLGTVEEGKRIFNINRFKSFLNSHGNSLVVIQNDDLIKVHVHTLKPGVVFNYAQNFGEFKKMKCENMTEQHHEILLNEQEKSEDEKSAAGKINHGSLEMPNKEEKKKEFALIATSSGKGVDEYFHEAGVDYIVSGGQTMNPSTGDFINVIKKSNAEHIYIFPNNSNIILSANQARDALIDEYDIETADDIQEALKDLLGGTIKSMMESEMDEHLGYESYERSDNDNYRNGTKKKTVRSNYGDFQIDVPQDRQSTFDPKIVKKRQKDISEIDQKIISMYARGLTTRQISDQIEEIYGFECSEGFISDVTDKIL